MAVSQSLTLTETNVTAGSNISSVKILWKSTQTGESWNGYTRTAKYYVSINGGAETEYSVSYSLPKNSTTIIVEKTITVNHKPDGSGTVKVRTWMDTDISAGVVEQTKSLSLTHIPRAATLDDFSSSTGHLTDTLTYKYTPTSSNYYHRCNIALELNGELIAIRSINLGQKQATQQTETITLTADERATIYNNITTDNYCRLRLTLRTYLDSGYTTQVDDGRSRTNPLSIFTSETLPTFEIAVTPVSDFVADSALYVKGLSKVKVVFSNVQAKFGATIKEYELSVGDTSVSVTNNTGISNYLTVSGYIILTASVKDSRGRSHAVTPMISVKDYTTPTIDSLTCSTSTFPGGTEFFPGGITYKYTPASSAFYSQCIISIGSKTIRTIQHGKANGQITQNVVFSEAELDAILRTIPNDKQGTLRFTFGTYSDSGYSKQISNDIYKEITLSIPDNGHKVAYPTFTRIDWKRITPLNAPLNALLIKGKSKLEVTVSGVVGKYGATIVSGEVTIAGKKATCTSDKLAASGEATYISDYLLAPGNVVLTVTVTDSRGFSRTSVGGSLTVLDYVAPRILPASGEDEVIAERCDSSGNPSDSGAYLRIKAKRDYSRLIVSGEQKNLCRIDYRYRADGGTFSAWTTILAANASSDEVDTGAILGSLDVAKSYFVQVRALDFVGEATSTSLTISTEKVYWHRAGSRGSFSFGKYAEEDNVFDIAEDKTAIFRGEVRFPGEAWVELALGTNVVASTVNSGRWGGSGVFYRVCAGGKHIYVAFNVSFTTSSSTVRAESYTLPSEYRPTYDVYALCPVGFADGSRGIATVSVSPNGRVNIYAVHKLPGATLSTGDTVTWIDGYIDFWT